MTLKTFSAAGLYFLAAMCCIELNYWWAFLVAALPMFGANYLIEMEVRERVSKIIKDANEKMLDEIRRRLIASVTGRHTDS